MGVSDAAYSVVHCQPIGCTFRGVGRRLHRRHYCLCGYDGFLSVFLLQCVDLGHQAFGGFEADNRIQHPSAAHCGG